MQIQISQRFAGKLQSVKGWPFYTNNLNFRRAVATKIDSLKDIRKKCFKLYLIAEKAEKVPVAMTCNGVLLPQQTLPDLKNFNPTPKFLPTPPPTNTLPPLS